MYKDDDLRQSLAWVLDCSDAYVTSNNIPRVADTARFRELANRRAFR